MNDCVVCSGKFSVLVLSGGCYDVPICKKHIEEITNFLRKKKDAINSKEGRK